MIKHNKSSYRKGMTLVELVLVLPLVSIIFIITYNLLFLSNKSFKVVNDSFVSNEELRIFQINIQKEANNGKKAEESKDVLHKVNGGEIYIYTDTNNDEKPEIVRYKLSGTNILRSVNTSTSTKYPYIYNINNVSSWKDEKVVLRNVTNTDIFGIVERVKALVRAQEDNDYRKKVEVNIKVKRNESNKTTELTFLIATKSRTEAD